MGFWSGRVICPECAARVHRQGFGIGRGCQWCGTELIVKVEPESIHRRRMKPLAVAKAGGLFARRDARGSD
ncbi:MAG TPA: hypothetical protein VN458_08590 [Solirubrobacterales bacterium]|nr:hypothetical protein [Solirubrobacterales bacterium]